LDQIGVERLVDHYPSLVAAIARRPYPQPPAQTGALSGKRMSKEEFERVFDTPVPSGSASQASLLERTTIVTLACTALLSVVGVVFTVYQGGLV